MWNVVWGFGGGVLNFDFMCYKPEPNLCKFQTEHNHISQDKSIIQYVTFNAHLIKIYDF
jgi:hypothetical protein